MGTFEPNMVVLDIGSQRFKAGFALTFPSDDEPRVDRPSVVEEHRPSTNPILHPVVDRGQIISFEGLETLIHHSLYESLGWPLGGEGGNVVISEAMLTSRADREMLTQLMFEVFNASGLFIQDQAVMSLYAVGKVSGCVVDVGHGKVDVSAVMDGQACSSSVRRIPFAGQDLTTLMADLVAAGGGARLSSHLPRASPSGVGRGDAELLKMMCAAVSESSSEHDAMMRGGSKLPGRAYAEGPDAPLVVPGEPQTYTLPDGQQVTVTTEGYQVGEALFRPELLPISSGISAGLAEVVIDCAQTPYEGLTRRAALENLLVCGGGSAMPNLAKRLLKEVRALASPPSLNPALCPLPEYLPKHAAQQAAWIGGAVVGRVVLNQGGFMSKHEYEEVGPVAIHRRCL